ncbi:AraC family transcriptional regulator [Mucilaginibacter daejeonensis]|uniref:AraC family transcriptional regulator n=1 Tax=Mucilaginibacter daejeonensis TaxID=398049 RepID=UPI001D17304F|nr:AraC family transcriptional regulator [Mucilaginibacter daejeonensis]UEG54606.1 AraC family transcriptional regulator [Mucilaginibacter daejeonensis]
MKPLYRKLPGKIESSFSVRHDVAPNYGNIWHYHAELELHYNIQGEGVRFIGDNIGNFAPGELILLGENLPHAWRCREEYYQANAGLNIEAVVMHFLPTCLGKDILALPETYMIPKLFERAKSGMIITGQTKERVVDLMKAALDATNIDRLIIMMSILKQLAETQEYKPIVNEISAFQQNTDLDDKRLSNIYTYTLSNYKRDITLKEISALSNLSVTSFCRYFKLMTNKTYYDFLTEIRISHACRQLVENKLTTELICFNCGFNNISNFYRHFKKIKGVTPVEYKRKYLNY